MSQLITQQPVVVTGASGYIAVHAIQQLIKKGYKVRGTVRSIKDKKKIEYLTALDPSGELLELVEADLLNEASWDAVISGTEYVLHLASPYALNVTNPQADLVDPALKGTLNVLKAADKSNTVKKVILTSSVAAITDSPIDGHIYTEKDWNTESSLSRNPYYYSKKLAEEAAWNFVKGKSFELVVINPFVVIGPEFNASTINPSVEAIHNILTGKFPGIISIAWCFVDVRDVAKAHILAMENPKASGRYICANETIWMKDMIILFKKHYPSAEYPKVDLGCTVGDKLIKMASYFQPRGTGQYIRTNLGKFPSINHNKIMEELGMEFIPLEKSLLDTSEDLIKKGKVSADIKKAKHEY